jgi:hypothetical protein
MERVKGIEPSSSAWKSGNAGDDVGVKKTPLRSGVLLVGALGAAGLGGIGDAARTRR